MDVFLSLLFIVVLFAFVAGLIKPAWIKQETRGRVLKFYGLGMLALLLLIGLVADPVEQAPAVAKGVAHEYQVIGKDDTSFAGRKRLRWVITAPTALTQADRAETAKAAAKALQDQTDADLAQVWLEVAPFAAGQGSQLAMATYTPDGCGASGKDCDGKKWDVEASDVQLTQEQLAVWKAWRENRDQFMEDGMVNEERLKSFLANKFGTTPDKITLPWVSREKVSG
ncbi:DUF4875 domain-containing protein [Salmonella enterica]|nr:DUF4875 domain-containing protein [Salmonella enterica]EHM1247561.1 DUF4875 domain-containing protein [Salmonella enterica]